MSEFFGIPIVFLLGRYLPFPNPVGTPKDMLMCALGFALIFVYPASRIFRRIGRSPKWSLLFFVPFAGPIAALLMISFGRWPAFDRASSDTKEVSDG